MDGPLIVVMQVTSIHIYWGSAVLCSYARFYFMQCYHGKTLMGTQGYFMTLHVLKGSSQI